MLNFNTAPYFDDFDKDNKFYRILYRPSYAVQGRELTQSQSILQEQIKKFGDHIFTEGAMVIPGQIVFDQDVSYQKMVSTYNQNNVNPDNFLGYTIVGELSGIEGIVVNVAPEDENDPLTFFLKIKNSGNDKKSIGFWDGETVYRKDDPQIRCTVEGTLNELNPTYESSGKASMTSIDKGVYYIHGMFIDNDAQSIIVSKYSRTPSCKVGLRVYESIITPEENISLTDNAQGSPNYAAPGAHRYKIDLKLEYIEEHDAVSDDFIVLQILSHGIVTKEIRTSEYNELAKTFARRTFDESGDYTVNPFSIIIKEHLREETNDKYKEGAYWETGTPTDVIGVYDPPFGDSTKLVAEMGIGKAYVQGFEINKISKSYVEFDKARDFDVYNNSVTNFSLGNYIKVENVHNIPRIDEFGEIRLYETISTNGHNNGDQVGTAKVRAIKRFGNISYLYLFDIVMFDGFNFEDDVKWIYDTNGNGINNFTCSPILDNNKVYLYDTKNNSLIFSLPNTTIKTLSVNNEGIDTNYASSRAYFNTGIVNNTATLVAKDNEVFQQNTEAYYISYADDGEVVTNPSFNFTGTPTGKVLEIGNLSRPVNIITPVTKTISTQKTKYIQTDESIIITNPNKSQNGRDYLGKADIYKVKEIYMSNNFNTIPTTNDTIITSRYIVDNGQRDNYYDVGSIILKSGENAPIGQILVVFDYFTHTEGDYFSVDSYVDIDFDYPVFYYSKESGNTYNLFDCFDFRPRMSDDRSGFTNTGGSIGELPQVFSDIRADYEYYLNRIDYLYLNYTGEFMVAKGISGINPKPPEKPEMGMVLYELNIPAYTFRPKDVKPTFKNNKRYTMRDIGDLDKRIGNLEYYTSLSLLERETASMEILDQNGLNRFKNGFIVDPFDSHGVGDVTHSDYNCSIDPQNKIMRPKFNDENIGLMYDKDNSSHVQKTGGIITLPYTESTINKQTQASKYENINPFAFRNIFGKLVFNPNSDVWHDKEKLPTLVVNNSPNYEALSFIADNVGDLNGIEWGRWHDVGGRINVTSSTTTTSWRETSDPNWTPESHSFRSLNVHTTSTTTTSWEQKQARKGLQMTHKDSNVLSESLGDRITEINYIPYMRSINVLIKTAQMKKETKVYPFFDGISMSKHCDPPSIYEYCTPASKIYFSSISGEFITSDYNEEVLIRSDMIGFCVNGPKVLFQTDEYLVVINMSENQVNPGETWVGCTSNASIVVESIEHNKLGDPLITGKYGEIALIWTIPNDDALTFMTGEREFVLTDQITNADPVHTKANGMFKSHGMSSKQEDTVLSTKTITFGKENVRQNRTIQRSNTTTSSWETGWIDPLAQSFLINEPGGCFLTKVRVWFQNKDSEESVICQIRNMVNGYPDQIFMATSVLQPKDVKISERSPGEPTDFYFPEPVYLKEGESYCFVLMPTASSASYNVWVAENGKIDINSNDIISGKESLGSLFKSQNASTWTPNQNEDIMFELSKAVFDIGTDGICQLVNDTIKPEKIKDNSIETQQGSEKIRIYHPNHGMTEGSLYHISGLEDGTDYNGFLGSQLNGTHTVIDTELDNFVITITGTQATDTGLIGRNIIGTRNYQLDVGHPLVNELIIDETYIDWSLQTTTGQSVNGNQTPYILEPFINIINNEDIDMNKPMLIASQYNEDFHLNGEKSLKLLGILHSDNPNVSPVIDAHQYNKIDDTGEDIYFDHSSSTFIAISNRIDFPSTTTWNIGSDAIFSVGAGEDELNIHHPDHNMGTGSFIYIEDFNDNISGLTDFNPNGLHEIRIIDKDNYLINMNEISTIGYSGSGDDVSGNHETKIAYSETHFVYVPENRSFNCSTSSRYMTKQVTLTDPAENFKLFFSAVRQQDADIDVYYKIRSPYEVTEWNEINWIRLDAPDEDVAISESNTDFKEYSFTVEIDEDDPNKPWTKLNPPIPYNTIAVKLVMKSTNSTQVPIFKDFRLICTT
jgi:hypothetical protein